MNEPKFFTAGDTVEWEESFSDYPASDGWALTYELRGASTLTVTGVADGDSWDLTITAAQSAVLVPDIYAYQAFVTLAAERYTVSEGTFEVRRNLAKTVKGYEARTHARKTLELIEEAIERYAIQPVETIAIGGRTIVRPSIGDLLKWRSHYKWLVQQEEREDKILRGQDPGGRILTRFK